MSVRASESFFQQRSQVVDIVIGAVTVGHQCPDPAAPVDEIRERRMLIRVAVAEDLFLGGDAVALADRRQLLLRPGAADKSRIEGTEILLEPGGVVPLWIHRDVYDLNIRSRCGELAARDGKGIECGWTYGRARCEAKSQQHHLAAIVTDFELAAIRAQQVEVRRRTGWVERAGLEHRRAAVGRAGVACTSGRYAGQDQQHRGPSHCRESHALNFTVVWLPDVHCARTCRPRTFRMERDASGSQPRPRVASAPRTRTVSFSGRRKSRGRWGFASRSGSPSGPG